MVLDAAFGTWMAHFQSRTGENVRMMGDLTWKLWKGTHRWSPLTGPAVMRGEHILAIHHCASNSLAGYIQ